MSKLSLRTVVYCMGSLVAAAGMAFVRPAFADTEIGALTKQVEALTRTVGTLSHRIDGLERKLDRLERARQQAPRAAVPKAAPPAAATAAVPPIQRVAPGELVPPDSTKSTHTVQGHMTVGEQAAIAAANYKPTPKEAWAQLEDGMSEAQVKALLGVPTKRFKAGGQTVWYYFYRDVGGGSVFFYGDGHVASRQRPPFSGSHWW